MPQNIPKGIKKEVQFSNTAGTMVPNLGYEIMDQGNKFLRFRGLTYILMSSLAATQEKLLKMSLMIVKEGTELLDNNNIKAVNFHTLDCVLRRI